MIPSIDDAQGVGPPELGGPDRGPEDSFAAAARITARMLARRGQASGGWGANKNM